MNTIRFDKISRYARVAEPVSLGIPFARGQLTDPERFGILNDGAPVAVQTSVTARWDDGSVKWLMTHFQADLPGNRAHELTFAYDGSGGNPVGHVPVMDVTEVPLDPPGGENLVLGVDVQAGRELSYGQNYFREYSWREPVGPASVDVMVLTRENYDLLAAGEPFEAGVLERDVPTASLEVPLDPSGQGLYVVVASPGRVVNAREVSVELATFAAEPDP